MSKYWRGDHYSSDEIVEIHDDPLHRTLKTKIGFLKSASGAGSSSPKTIESVTESLNEQQFDEPSYGDIQATGVLSKTRRPSAARLFSGFLVSKEGQQKIADLDNVVVRKDVEPKIALDRSKLRVIDPAEGNRIDYYMGLINDLFVKAN
jgi:hypothetical protein